jgi:hypothetical protein
MQFPKSFVPYVRDPHLPWQDADYEMSVYNGQDRIQTHRYKFQDSDFTDVLRVFGRFKQFLRDSSDNQVSAKFIQTNYIEIDSSKPTDPLLANINYVIVVTPELAYLFGFRTDVDTSATIENYPTIRLPAQGSFTSPHPIDLTRLLPNHILVYSDLVRPTLMGSTYQQVIKYVPISKDDLNSYESEHLEFVNIHSNYIPSFHVWIGTTGGKTIKFKEDDAEVLFNFVFRKLK